MVNEEETKHGNGAGLSIAGLVKAQYKRDFIKGSTIGT